MAKKPAKKSSAPRQELKKLQRFSLWFFHRPRKTALIWLIVAFFGAASYGTLLKREGFPPVATPFAIASGSYLVNDSAQVDRQITKPLSDYLLKQEGVKSIQGQSFGDFYNLLVYYEESVDSAAKSKSLSAAIDNHDLLPSQATFSIRPYEFGFTERGDEMVLSFYSPEGASNEELVAQANRAADFIEDQKLPLVKDVAVSSPFDSVYNPQTQRTESLRKSFDRFGKREGDRNTFYRSVVIGVLAHEDADNLQLHDQVTGAINKLNGHPDFNGFHAEISASYAPQIEDQISELQTALLEGLLAVLIVGSIVIAFRASAVTVLSMITVLAVVNGLLYLIGYSLNTITLFALILSLSLIVDDTIIMVEAIDAQRRKHKKADKIVSEATRKVGRAMIAATSTSAISFAPLLFVSGILGGFIRAIPITIISALLISLLVALVFIPLFARYLLLGKKQVGEENVHEVAAGVEARIARFISGPMLWAKGSTRKLMLVGISAVIIGVGFIGAGGFLSTKVGFNIFPQTKDSNQISAQITYHPNTDLTQAEAIADQVDHIVADTVDANFVRASYYGQASIERALLFIDITDYKERDITAPDLIKLLNLKFDQFAGADVEAAQIDVGPPTSTFTVQIRSDQNRQASLRLADDIAKFLQTEAKLKRPDGTTAKIDKVSIGNSSIYIRNDGKSYVTVNAKFADTDTSTLVTLAEEAVQNEFNQSKVKSYGLQANAVEFFAGQEEENQESFKTLMLAFPVLLLAIYVLLAFQFRSLLQPLLIFMAIPFSLFGIMLGLYLTDNVMSFFAMLGFFALIGLSIKNTILLTDYANQARAGGMNTVDAAHEALAERFRPLIATSLTAVVSLIPLALSSPFWEGLAVVLIFGLLSSTFLVITVFPYYYLGAEYLRHRINRRTGVTWLVMTIGLAVLLKKAALLAPLLAVLIMLLIRTLVSRQRA